MKALILSILKYASLPLALLYGLIIYIRNKFYDWKIFSSMEFNIPVICVGNITVGGTGKSPHIEYLIELLKPHYTVATLSRGYRRKTRGFRLAQHDSTAADIGDEPFQFKMKYPDVDVCVAEDRMTAIPQLLQHRPYTQTILLDDAFQHRTVRAGLNILLSDYERLYTRDFIMPFGLLRESKQAAERAEIIVVTKCENGMTAADKEKIIRELNPLPHQHVFFTSVVYGSLYPLHATNEIVQAAEVLLVTGIANPVPLQQELEKKYRKVYTLSFPDHHYYSFDDLEEIKIAFQHISSENKIIVTTEKDAARLMLLQEKIIPLQIPIYVQRISVDFLFNQKEEFDNLIQNFVAPFYPPPPPIVEYPEGLDSLTASFSVPYNV